MSAEYVGKMKSRCYPQRPFAFIDPKTDMSKVAKSYTFFDKVRKRWVARYCPVDPVTGKQKNLTRYCLSKTEAVKASRELIAAWEDRQSKPVLQPSKITFEQLALEFSAKKLVNREYLGDKKIAGVSDPVSARGWLKQLRLFFGARLLAQIKLSDLEAFKLWLSKIPAHSVIEETPGGELKLVLNKTGAIRSLNSLHRPLELARTIWRYAVTQGYLAHDQNPFLGARGLIEHGAESKRDRFPSFGEEMALLAVCVGNRAHLREILIVALDTGLRRNEALTLQISDIHFARNVIGVRKINSKTGKVREIPMTKRVQEVMEGLCREKAKDDLIFGGLKEIKRSFLTARRLAGIADLRFHDLRHRFVTTAFLAGIPQAVVLKASGHSSDEWRRYLNVGSEQLNSLLEPLKGQSVAEVEDYALQRMRELRAALGYERIARLLSRLD